MGNLDVKYLFESQCELIDNIKELLKVLDGKKYGKELERLYEEFIDEIREHVYSKKESKKILVTLYFSLKIFTILALIAIVPSTEPINVFTFVV